jgi:hypothetical protein
MRTFGELSKKLIEVVRTIDPSEARQRINLAYKRASEAHPWQHLLKRFTLQTEAPYNTGTIAVTESSASVTLTDGTWTTSWATSPSMRRMSIAGRAEPYDVSSFGSATTATLADVFIGDTDADAAYNLYRDVYPLPTDCGMAKVLVIYDPTLRLRLRFFNQPKFLSVRSVNPTLISTPECFTVVNQTSETPPRPQIQMYPAPDSVRSYHGWYFRRPSFLSTDASYPDWPEEYEDMLWLDAAIDYYRMPRNHSPKYLAEFKPWYADLFRKMKVQMDGNSAIDFEIEQAQLGRGNGGWNPDPSGLSGTGSVSW